MNPAEYKRRTLVRVNEATTYCEICLENPEACDCAEFACPRCPDHTYVCGACGYHCADERSVV
jgi:hypothetical protein